jgi:hypothetical protein
MTRVATGDFGDPRARHVGHILNAVTKIVTFSRSIGLLLH